MAVEKHRSISRTQRIGNIVGERMRVRHLGFQNHKGGDVDGTHAESRAVASSVLANSRTRAPAGRCLSASLMERKTGCICFELAIGFTWLLDWRKWAAVEREGILV